MARQPNTVGGGARTNHNGLHFEQTSELRDVLGAQKGLSILGDNVFKDGVHVATLFQKNSLYRNLLEPRGVDFRTILSKKMLPDDAILVGDTLYIIEKKFQSVAGSVDEKLQTCDFKKQHYQRLFRPLNITVEYCYYLSDWFQRPEYRDVKEYILSVGCRFFFDEIPLEFLGL